MRIDRPKQAVQRRLVYLAQDFPSGAPAVDSPDHVAELINQTPVDFALHLYAIELGHVQGDSPFHADNGSSSH